MWKGRKVRRHIYMYVYVQEERTEALREREVETRVFGNKRMCECVCVYGDTCGNKWRKEHQDDEKVEGAGGGNSEEKETDKACDILRICARLCEYDSRT